MHPDVRVRAHLLDELAARLPAALREAARDSVKALRSGLPERLVATVEERVKQCRAVLATT